MSGGAAGGSSQGSVVRVVGNVPACVPGGGDASLADLQIGIDNANHYVVRIRQILQCARDVGERAAQTACQNSGSDLARHLGHGDALGMAMWGKHKQCTCDVKHVETVFDWAVEGHGGINVMVQEQRDELVAAVHKAACNLAATKLTRSRDAMADSIGVEIAGVDAEVNRLCAGLESAKEDLLRTHTELAVVKAEADVVSHALTGVKLDLEREGRTCKALEADVKNLRAQLRAAHEVQRVPEEVSRFLATTAEVQLQQPEITGLAVPVAFTLHVPVQRDGECEYETMAASCRTKETSMLALGLEMLLKEVFFRDASENLARALGIAGGVFDTARWPDAVIAQADV